MISFLAERQRVLVSLLGSMKWHYGILYILAALSAVLEMVSVGLILPLVDALTRQGEGVASVGLVGVVIARLSGLSLLYLAGILFVVFLVKSGLKLVAPI